MAFAKRRPLSFLAARVTTLLSGTLNSLLTSEVGGIGWRGCHYKNNIPGLEDLKKGNERMKIVDFSELSFISLENFKAMFRRTPGAFRERLMDTLVHDLIIVSYYDLHAYPSWWTWLTSPPQPTELVHPPMPIIPRSPHEDWTMIYVDASFSWSDESTTTRPITTNAGGGVVVVTPEKSWSAKLLKMEFKKSPFEAEGCAFLEAINLAKDMKISRPWFRLDCKDWIDLVHGAAFIEPQFDDMLRQIVEGLSQFRDFRCEFIHRECNCLADSLDFARVAKTSDFKYIMTRSQKSGVHHDFRIENLIKMWETFGDRLISECPGVVLNVETDQKKKRVLP